MSDTNENRVYVVQSDPKALMRVNRCVRIVVFVVITLFLTVACWIGQTDMPRGGQVETPLIVTLWIVGVLATAFLCFLAFVPVKGNDVWIGGDFIAGSPDSSCSGLAVVRYRDIARVTLDLSRGCIAGTTIHARHMTVIPVKRAEQPAIVIKVIFDHAPENVTWRRSWRPFTRLSREEVTSLIEASHPPDIFNILPPGAAYATADQMFPRQKSNGKGVFARVFAKNPVRSAEMISLRSPTPASRYVSFMLLQMLETGSTTQVLRRSDPLPALHFRGETAEPLQFQNVLDHLRTQCGLGLIRTSGPMDGTFDATVQGTRCRILCQFNNSEDVCCEIRLEKTSNRA